MNAFACVNSFESAKYIDILKLQNIVFKKATHFHCYASLSFGEYMPLLWCNLNLLWSIYRKVFYTLNIQKFSLFASRFIWVIHQHHLSKLCARILFNIRRTSDAENISEKQECIQFVWFRIKTDYSQMHLPIDWHKFFDFIW